MSDRRFIKPADGLTVRDQAGTALPPHGKGVAWDSWWQRRLNDGDIEATDEDAVRAGEKAAEAAEVKAGGDVGAVTAQAETRQGETRRAKAGAKEEETGK